MRWTEWFAFALVIAGIIWRLRAFERGKDAKVQTVNDHAEELIHALRAEHEDWLDRLGKQLDKHEHTLYGEDGNNGQKAVLRDLLDWRYGRGVYGPKDLETRCRHDAQNEIQKTMDKLADEMKMERRRLPKRGA